MRRIFSIIVLCMFACVCECVAYEIRGTLTGAADGTLVFLEDVYPAGQIDTAVVKNGKFVFKSNEHLKNPRYCHILIKGDATDPFSARISSFFVDNTVMTFESSLDSLSKMLEHTGEESNVRITGSLTQELYNVYLTRIREVRKRYDVLRHRAGKVFTTKNSQPSLDFEQKMQITSEMRDLEDELNRVGKQFVQEHRESVVSALVLKSMVDRMRYKITVKELSELQGMLDPRLDEVELVQSFKKSMNREVHQVMRGMRYYDVELVDTTGNKVMLSDFVKPGQYNFLDFWASGCVPCRKEIPHILEIRERCGEKLNIISISLDKKQVRWKKALEEEKMPWEQLCNPDGFGGCFDSTYRVPAIPLSILVNPEGMIEYVNLHHAELDKALIDLGIWKR